LIGNVYGVSANNETISEIRFSIGLAPGAQSVDLTKLTVAFSTPNSNLVILSHGGNASETMFTAKEGGYGPSLDSMIQNQQIEIAFKVAPVPVNTPVTIEIRPPVGAILPFAKITPSTITTINVLS
jgi:archaellin